MIFLTLFSIRPFKDHLWILRLLFFKQALLLLYRHGATVMAPTRRAENIHELMP